MARALRDASNPLQPNAVYSAADAKLFASLKQTHLTGTLLPQGDGNARARRHALLLGREQPSFAAPPSAAAGSSGHHQQQHDEHRALQGSISLDVPPTPPLMPPPPEAPPPPPPYFMADERDVLTELYEAMGGPAWNTSANWLDGYPCDEPIWQGVVCTLGPPLSYDEASTPSPPPNEGWEGSGRVHRLILGANNLNGTLPGEYFRIWAHAPCCSG